MMRRHRMLLAAAIAVLAVPVTVATSASAHTMGDGSTMNDNHRGPGAVVDLIRAAFASAPFLRFDNAAGGGYIGKVADKAAHHMHHRPERPERGRDGRALLEPRAHRSER